MIGFLKNEAFKEVIKSMKSQTLIFALALVISLLAITVEAAQKNNPSQRDESLRRGEMRQTLDPDLFNDPKVKRAYQIAREIPWVLDSIYCYCLCEESPVFRHKSLLSCYVDNHAAM